MQNAIIKYVLFLSVVVGVSIVPANLGAGVGALLGPMSSKLGPRATLPYFKNKTTKRESVHLKLLTLRLAPSECLVMIAAALAF